MWDNFGPLHADRISAVINKLGATHSIVAIQHQACSDIYSWTTSETFDFDSVTLAEPKRRHPLKGINLLLRLVPTLIRSNAQAVFLCHYQDWPTAISAMVLRLMGRHVYLMGCAKFDDRPRSAYREALKSIVLLPYQGALVGSRRTQEFFEFLGLRGTPFVLGYNTVSNQRMRNLAGNASLAQFSQRDFVIVARLVSKKNLGVALEAFGLYRARVPHCTRRLHICGDGPLELDLKQQANRLGIENHVVFHGFLQSEDVAPIIASAVALLLVSTEEQFGNVVPEALALGVPVILSDICGARYTLLESSVNGWLVEASNPAGIATAMLATTASETEWRKLSEAALAMAPKGDVEQFAIGVETLLNSKRKPEA